MANQNKYVTVVLVIFLLSSVQLAYPATSTSDKSPASKDSPKAPVKLVKDQPLICTGPTTKVKVTVKQSSTTYTFSVTNSLGYALHDFSIGYDDSWGYYGDDNTIPKDIKSPPNWGGDTMFPDEGGLYVYWTTYEALIKPGTTLSGFVVEMPAVYDKLKQLPFEARYYKNGKTTCVWGWPVGASKTK